MKKILVLSLLAVFALALTAGCEVSTANLQDVKVCDDPNDENQCESDKSTFDADTEEIFVSGSLENAPDDTKLDITWNYLGEEGDEKEEIDTVSLTGGSATFHSNLAAPSGGWLAGEYEIVLDLGTDNSEPVIKNFTIKGEAKPAGDDLLSDLKLCDSPDEFDECPANKDTFATDTPIIYLSGAIAEVPVGTEIEIVWRYLGGEAGDEQDIDSVVLTADDTPNVFFSNLEAPTDGWPTGDYEVVINLDGKKEASVEFSVE
ncbi:MAG: hypothetical protein C4534_06340 [Gaiellales bacterium]|nr:MAG: hypothetical protein C4534_06340 [Gaiellales bacterium]